MSSETIALMPIYGWGWSNHGVSIDTPEPFVIRVIYSEIDKSKIYGIIETEGHKFHGYKTTISRGSSFPNHFKLSGEIGDGDAKRYLTGFVKL